jgi:DNA-binding PadR family transcriptional regulator
MARKLASRNRVARSMMSRLDELPTTRRVGDTKLAVLEMLSHGTDYAYSLRKRLASEIGRTISLVSMYQHLSELEEMGLISVDRHERSPERRMRVYYSIMDRGTELLGRENPGR